MTMTSLGSGLCLQLRLPARSDHTSWQGKLGHGLQVLQGVSGVYSRIGDVAWLESLVDVLSASFFQSYTYLPTKEK